LLTCPNTGKGCAYPPAGRFAVLLSPDQGSAIQVGSCWIPGA
jgi:hypothetical protein